MRNRKTITAVLLGGFVWPTLAWAQGSAASQGKIGIINIQQAIASTGEGKKAFAEIQTKFQPRQQELQRQQQEIQALNEQLQKGANALSDEEQRRLNRELEEKQKLFKRTQEDADSDYRGEAQDVIQRIGRKMVPIIDDYAKQNGFAMVFDPAAAQVPLYYLAPDIDITSEIVRRYDAANPVADAPATSGANSPPSPATRPAPAAPKPVSNTKPPVPKPKP